MSARSDAGIEIGRTLESIREVVAAGDLAGVSEADTRAHFIDPLIRSLGYRKFAEVQREVYTSAKEFLDYVLIVNGQRRIAVEAKRLSHKLTEQDAAQVIQYCAVLGIEWAVLTNGRELRLYHQYAHGPVSDKLLFRLDLVGWGSEAELDALVDQMWLLSRDAFTGRDGPMAWMRAQRLDAALRDALTNPDSVEVKYLRKRLADLGIVDAATAEVAGWFKARLLEPGPVPGGEGPDKQGPGKVSAKAAGGKLPARPGGTQPTYWMLPAAARQDVTALESVQRWLTRGMWGMWESTPGRKAIRAGDWLAIHAGSTGVVAYGRVTATPDVQLADEELPEPQEKPTYRVPLSDIAWVTPPVVIDLELRAKLDAFKGRDPAMKAWGWVVQTTRRVSEADFRRLTGRA